MPRKFGSPPRRKFDPNTKASLSLRLCPTKVGSWIALGPRAWKLEAGVRIPTRRYKKDVIKTGDYYKASENLEFTVEIGTLANWVLQFKKMRVNGVEVPVTDGHENAGSTKNKMGEVDDLWVEDNALWMSCTLVGQESLRAAVQADVSLFSPSGFIDGKRNLYVRPIRHVAMCTDSVVPGLGAFIPLAASHSLGLQGVPRMLEWLQKLAAALGLDPGTLVDDATAMQAIEAQVAALMEELGAKGDAGEEGKPNPIVPVGAAGSGAPNSPVTKKTVTEEFRAAHSNAEGEASKPNAMVVKMMAENRSLKIKALVEGGKITPKVAETLALQFIGKQNEVVALALSQDSDGSDFETVIGAFEANEPVKPGEKTGAQTKPTLRLADGMKDKAPEKSGLVADAEKRAEAAQKRRVG